MLLFRLLLLPLVATPGIFKSYSNSRKAFAVTALNISCVVSGGQEVDLLLWGGVWVPCSCLKL